MFKQNNPHYAENPDLDELSEKVKNAIGKNVSFIIDIFFRAQLLDREDVPYAGMLVRPIETIDALVSKVLEYYPDFKIDFEGALENGVTIKTKEFELLKRSMEGIQVYAYEFRQALDIRSADYQEQKQLTDEKNALLFAIEIAHFNKLFIETSVTQAAFRQGFSKAGADLDSFLEQHGERFEQALRDVNDVNVMYGFSPFDVEDELEDSGYFFWPVEDIAAEQDSIDDDTEGDSTEISMKLSALLYTNSVILEGNKKIFELLESQNEKLDQLLRSRKDLH